MKILTINTRYLGGGGAAYIAHTIHHQLNEKELHQSLFLYGRGIEGDQYSKRITVKKTDYLSALTYRVFGKEVSLNLNFEKEILACDIVHLHNIHGYYLNDKLLFDLLKKHNKKIVWTLHDMWPVTGRCAYSFGCEKYLTGCGNCKNLKTYPKSIMDNSAKEWRRKKEMFELISAENLTIVTPSQWLGDICKSTFLSKFKICCIPNGIEHTPVSKSKTQLKEQYHIEIDKKVILFVAADTRDERKGIKYILEMIPTCSNYIFLSIGKKIDNIEYDNFIQLGYISNRAKINEIYYLSDVFVIPSLDDNFPTTVLEAFANETPVVGFNQGGIPEQISECTGIIVKDVSSEGLKQGIITLLENEELLQDYSKEARQKFQNEYTLETFMNKYIHEYEMLGDNA